MAQPRGNRIPAVISEDLWFGWSPQVDSAMSTTLFRPSIRPEELSKEGCIQRVWLTLARHPWTGKQGTRQAICTQREGKERESFGHVMHKVFGRYLRSQLE
ncbi:hypothetical protein TEQG_08372 [Trichophyton equinum CBS 127.97]|uniref:Uncharacterized protein n=1 Tax=Trichophyton equinum (strain ATCC MYA-4606 / CBS 127.97) TaxID=559882 RepID=F2Q5G9_TRIEC|nr:hypothetical protein TEQG_08372 [Trichophyton equinum CBS 127.97]